MTGELHDSTSELDIIAFAHHVSRVVEQLESGQDIDIGALELLLTQMDQMVSAVVDLALEHPQIPAQFGRARQRLRAHIRNRRPNDVNEPAKARFAFQGLIDLAKSEDDLRRQQDCLETEAWALLMRGDTTAAAQRLGQALDFLDRRRSFVSDEKQQIFFAKEGRYLVARFLNEYLRRQDWARAFELVERTKSRALLSQLGIADIRKPTDVGSALSDTEGDLLRQARETADGARRNANTSDGVRGFELWDQAATLQLALDKVWTSLARHSTWAEYVSLRRGTAPDLQQIRKCLRWKKVEPRTALLSYFVDEKTTWLFVLGCDAPDPVAVDTGVPPDHLRACAQRLLIDCNGLASGYPENEEPHLKKLIEEALKLPPAIRSRSSRQLPEPDPRTLLGPKYDFTYLDDLSPRLLPPFVHPLLQNCAVLCISAHGPLHALPLHALRWSDGTYVAERFGVCYVPSAGVLRHCQDRNPARRATSSHRPRTGLVACVDMFGEQSAKFEQDSELLAPLSESKGQQACKVLTGSKGPLAATKRRVIEGASHADVVHLSCHGIFARDRGWKDPLQSAILLADGQRSRIEREDLGQKPQDFADCLLTARETYNLRLKAALVALGACSTGRTQVEAGDDLLGLSRAWLYAGSASVLLSLWDVNTQSSHRLLQVFYQQWLKADQPKWRALQAAQQALRDDDVNLNFRHPYHWAPFVLIGDWV